MKYALIGLLFFMVWGVAPAQENALFERATKAYNEGNYSKALEDYQRILERGKHSAELYFNMGNAHYKLEHVAESIYYYEKALLLKPNDAEITNNLGYAQNMRLDAIEEMPQTAFRRLYTSVVHVLSYEQWAKISIGGMLLFVLAFVAYYLFELSTRKRIFFIGGSIFLLLSLITFVLAQLAHKDYKAENPAIVHAREVVVAAEPNTRAERVFTLHEGTKVFILDDLDAWVKIQIADGQIGWVPSESVKVLKDFQ